MFYLIVEELAEILHIHFAFLSIYHNDGAVNMNIHGPCHIFHCFYHIGKLAHTGGLDQDAVRSIGIQHFLQGCSEISHQGTADTAGIHLIDLDAGILQESAVNTDLTEFIFNQYNLLPLECLFQEFLINVVFPAPKKPDIMVISVIIFPSFSHAEASASQTSGFVLALSSAHC